MPPSLHAGRGWGWVASKASCGNIEAMRRIPPRLTTFARNLRNNGTTGERILWQKLSRYRPRFTRQLVVGPFIVDLACRQAKLAIELDGGQHTDAAEYAARRTSYLKDHGWDVLRLWNNEVEANADGAAEMVLGRCADRLGGTHPQPLPSREGRERRQRSRAAP